ncbi:ferredoxin 1-like protein [Capsaspora owczarzaki ATCC 30864]|uniref:Ferredoxin 1-like protein n=1 Tax=Capsaspora owczarzaki (strain ATCC 30864) TaxID=595528 RepID=A0A0D2WVZ5_CAPO3|nr:ferredoxin 1-like protein [Capsaspora owczarzaki ATCC 30864]KJE96543.1 ferredoxin 1-like protein [Capsaspora owczarzaki ATCC 30864]|eukprot:XP_004344471.1 ferredoxin 1-like protein [Capsaspora owczarzaki ATCC 30864]
MPPRDLSAPIAELAQQPTRVHLAPKQLPTTAPEEQQSVVSTTPPEVVATAAPLSTTKTTTTPTTNILASNLSAVRARKESKPFALPSTEPTHPNNNNQDGARASSSGMTREDVSRAWTEEGRQLVIVHHKVYNVENFLPTHPGGSAIVRKYLGTDITHLMAGRRDDLISSSGVTVEANRTEEAADNEEGNVQEHGAQNGHAKINAATHTSTPDANQAARNKPLPNATPSVGADESEEADGNARTESVAEKNAGVASTRSQVTRRVHRHSPSAYRILDCYCLGYVAGEEHMQLQRSLSVDDPELAKLEAQIDYSRGIIQQVHRLGAGYDKWVHSPIAVSLRMFDSNLLEALSRTRWYVIPLVWIPVVVALSLLSLYGGAYTLAGLRAGGENPVDQAPFPAAKWTNASGVASIAAPNTSPTTQQLMQASWNELTFQTFAFVFLGGILLWTLLEYSLHRFVFHAVPSRSAFWITFHYLMHGVHHKSPMDGDRLVFPPAPAAIVITLLYSLFVAALPLGLARALVAGALFGYVCYDLTHYFLHHGTPTSEVIADMKSYHMAHHYVNHDLGYGISSKLWDFVWGTVLDYKAILESPTTAASKAKAE